MEEFRRDTMYLTVTDSVATLVLNRPAVLNCINEEWLANFEDLLYDMSKLNTVKTIIIRGAGRAFCSGIDLSALSEHRISDEFFESWERALRQLETMEAVTVAAVHSYCIGGGLQLALACDLTIATEDATFGLTATNEGIIPGMGMWRLARQIGAARTKRLVLTHDLMDARTALEWGFVDYVAKRHQFEEVVNELAARLCSAARPATNLTKQLCNIAQDLDFDSALRLFHEFQTRALNSDDHKAAMLRWRQRRAMDDVGNPKSAT
jgi:enoyl-CoA hydratase